MEIELGRLLLPSCLSSAGSRHSIAAAVQGQNPALDSYHVPCSLESGWQDLPQNWGEESSIFPLDDSVSHPHDQASEVRVEAQRRREGARNEQPAPRAEPNRLFQLP